MDYEELYGEELFYWLDESQPGTTIIKLSMIEKIWKVIAKIFYDGLDNTRLF